MGPQHLDQRLQPALELTPPRDRGVDVHHDLAPDVLRHALQQVVLAAEVPVQRHRGDAQVLGQLADGQRVEPVGVGELERAVDHGALAEPRPLAVRFRRLRVLVNHLTTVHRKGNDYNVHVRRIRTSYRYDVHESQGKDIAVSASTVSAEQGKDSRRWWALAAVSLAAFMTYLDNNIVNVAIPTIQHSLHLSVSGLEWVVSSYLLTVAGLLLVGGRLADVFGRRRLFLAGMAVFTLSSLVAGLAGSGGVLIASRAVQGVGAALLMPPTLAIIMATFTNIRERNTAIGIWAAVSALALALGPVAGGLISQHLHWGWIFLINVPVGVITFAIAVFYVDESRAGSAVRQLDLPGLVTSALSLFALTYALIEGNVSGWTAPLILGAFAVAAVAAAAFLAIEARTAHPMVDLSMFRRREFSGGSGTMMIWAFGILGIYFFTSLYLQQTLGFSPVKAGLAFVPMALCV